MKRARRISLAVSSESTTCEHGRPYFFHFPSLRSSTQPPNVAEPSWSRRLTLCPTPTTVFKDVTGSSGLYTLYGTISSHTIFTPKVGSAKLSNMDTIRSLWILQSTSTSLTITRMVESFSVHLFLPIRKHPMNFQYLVSENSSIALNRWSQIGYTGSEQGTGS